ncbi:hypothetical protein E3J48_07865 [Candidatus Aerophobetes bacterium]|uniref:Uncharacterized protein n=1 Tax=Aerophobetes bacterium TaxID=2030807 RepID=A0A523VX69_UNCAE|nr:MAG: hypothetical protein E3J48_07865 [Candidatus Aerophobetes bacterium]
MMVSLPSLYFYKTRLRPGKFDHLEGIEYIDKVIVIDQSPIGRTPRSNAREIRCWSLNIIPT